MSVGILLITHPGAGQALLAVAERLLGRMPLAVSCFEVDYDTEFSDLIAAASTALRALNYADSSLDELADKAAAGGKLGVVVGRG